MPTRTCKHLFNNHYVLTWHCTAYWQFSPSACFISRS